MGDVARKPGKNVARIPDPGVPLNPADVAVPIRADNLARPIDPSGNLSSTTGKYLAKPVWTVFQWVQDKLLTGEQVTAGAYRHHRQQQPDRDLAVYPEREFTSTGDAMLKGLIHKTEWDWTDVAHAEDWYGTKFEHGRWLHSQIDKHRATLANPDAHTPAQIEYSQKQIKASQDAIDFGNTVCGFFSGIAFDPFTWTGPAIAKLGFKAVAIPLKALHKGVLVKLGKYSRLSTKLTQIKKLTFTGGKSYGIKINEGFREAVMELRKAGVSDDLITKLDKGLLTADDIIPTLKPTIENLDEVVMNLRKIESIQEVMETVAKGEGELLATEWLGTKRLQEPYDVLEKMGRSKEARALLDVMEKAKVEKVDGTYGLAKGFYKAMKEAGVTDDVIDDIIKRNRGFSTQPLMADNPMAGAVRSTIEASDRAPLFYELDEFYEGLDETLKHVDPKLRPLLDQHRRVYKELGEELIKKDILTKQTLDAFAKELGLSHLRHYPKNNYWQFIKKAGVAKRHSMLEDAKKGLDQLRKDLKKANIPSAEADDVLAAAKADIKKLARAKRGTEAVGESDALRGLYDAAHALHEKYPDIAMGTILKKFRGSVKDVSSFRSVMGTLNEIDDLAKSAGFKKVIETNPAAILFKQEVQMKRAIAYHDFIERTIKNFPAEVQRWAPGMDDAGKIVVKDAFMGKYYVDEDFADTFRLILGMETGTGKIWHQHFRWFDWMQEKFRYYTLIPFFKFHSRNLFSEEFMNSIGGMSALDPVWMKTRKRATKLAFDALSKKDPIALEAYAHIMKQGTLGHGWFAAELGLGTTLRRGGGPFPFMGKDYDLGKLSIRRSRGIGTKVLPKMELGGELIEAIPRLHMYYYGLEKGPGWVAKQMSKKAGLRGLKLKAAKGLTGDISDDLTKALDRYKIPYRSPDGLVDYTRKFHPTYDKFTPLEQKVLRRAFPFYSWPRFNIPFSFEMMMRKPRAYAQLERGRRFVTRARGAQLPDKDAPDYIKQGYAVGWSRTGPNQTYQVMKNWLTPVDIDDVIPIINENGEWKWSVKPIADKIQQMLTPIVKQPLETFITRKDSYTKKDLPSYPGAKAVLGGIPFTDKTIKIGERPYHMLKAIRVLQETNKFFWGRRDNYWDAVVGHLFGRMYSVDINTAKRHLYHSFMDQLHGQPGLNKKGQETGLLTGRKRAMANKDWATVKELDKRIRLIERELARLKPYVIKKKLKREREGRKRPKRR